MRHKYLPSLKERKVHLLLLVRLLRLLRLLSVSVYYWRLNAPLEHHQEVCDWFFVVVVAAVVVRIQVFGLLLDVSRFVFVVWEPLSRSVERRFSSVRFNPIFS